MLGTPLANHQQTLVFWGLKDGVLTLIFAKKEASEDDIVGVWGNPTVSLFGLV